MSTGYRLGVALEYRVKELLERDGYYVVRSAASKGVVDLAAMKPGQLLLVQAKRSGSLGPSEWNDLYDLAVRLGAVPVMARKGLRRTELYRLTARKDGSRRRQPMEPFVIDEPAATGESE